MPLSVLKAMIPDRLIRRRLPPQASDAVLLTFDDGPTPDVTEGVMDRLERHGARAVFFLVGGKIASAPQIPAEIVRRGHAVGHHSLHHDSRRWQSPLRWWRHLIQCRGLIEKHAGVPCRLYRAPEGRISPMTLFGPPLAGLRHVQWSLDSKDWACPDASAAREIARDIDRFIRPRDIVLCHDFGTVVFDLLDELLPSLRRRGLDLAGGLDALDGRSK